MRHRQIGIALGLAALLAALTMGPASASYPGEHNGRIAVGVRANGAANIFTLRADGSGMRQLTTGPGFKLCPSYSPDGQTIAYCATAGDAFEIWTMKQNGKKQRQLTHLGGFATFPDFSPDASKIAFAGTEGEDPNGEIYTVNARTGGSLHALTSCATFAPGCFNDLPVWSPDGTKIAFIHADDSNDDGAINQQVWVMDSDGQHQHPLTSSAVPHDQVPDWSPDGSRIVFHAGGFGSGGIWVMNADGSHQHQISGCQAADATPCATGDDWGPTWSPDGRKIVFLRDLQALGTADRPIIVMNADGSGQHRITTAPILCGVPAWQPRGASQGG
jgi:Tol biopolymer transport system component